MNLIVKERKEKEEKKKVAPAVITPDEKKQMFVEGIKKTVVPAFIGAAFAFLFIGTAGKISGKPWYLVLLLVVLVSYYIQRFIYPSLSVRVHEFEFKDWMYVEFLTIIYTLVFWTLLLN